MPKDCQPLSKIYKFIHKRLDTYTLSLIALEGESKALNVLKSLVQEMNLNIDNTALEYEANKIGELIANIATCQTGSKNYYYPMKVADTVRELTIRGMGVQGSVSQSDLVMFIRGFLMHIYPYVLGEKELFVGECQNCRKLFYKTSKNKIFCSEACSSMTRWKRYRARLREYEKEREERRTQNEEQSRKKS